MQVTTTALMFAEEIVILMNLRPVNRGLGQRLRTEDVVLTGIPVHVNVSVSKIIGLDPRSGTAKVMKQPSIVPQSILLFFTQKAERNLVLR